MLEALHFGRQRLQKAGVPDYEYDANALLQAASGQSLAYILGHPEEELPEEAMTAYPDMLASREQRIPLQQILGETCFYGYMFRTRKGTLIPRSDTECLVEEALRTAPKRDIRFLDLCTGSGCIGISFLLERKKAGYQDKGILTDISPEALELARENAELLEAEADAEVLASDLFDAFSGSGETDGARRTEDADDRFDLIMSNPPYIPKEAMTGLMPEVRLHEPWLALTDEGDGLSFYRRIAEGAGQHLKSDGYLVLEIGYDQGQAVPEILKEAGYRNIKVIKDLAGLDRVVTACL